MKRVYELEHTRIAPNGEIELRYYSLPITEQAAAGHIGGLQGYLNEVGAEIVEVLIKEAASRGAYLKKNVKTIPVMLRTRTDRVKVGGGPEQGGSVAEVQEWQKWCKAIFTMTLCIEEFGYHLDPHTPGCAEYDGEETGVLFW